MREKLHLLDFYVFVGKVAYDFRKNLSLPFPIRFLSVFVSWSVCINHIILWIYEAKIFFSFQYSNGRILLREKLMRSIEISETISIVNLCRFSRIHNSIILCKNWIFFTLFSLSFFFLLLCASYSVFVCSFMRYVVGEAMCIHIYAVHARAVKCDGWYPLQPTIFYLFFWSFYFFFIFIWSFRFILFYISFVTKCFFFSLNENTAKSDWVWVR